MPDPTKRDDAGYSLDDAQAFFRAAGVRYSAHHMVELRKHVLDREAHARSEAADAGEVASLPSRGDVGLAEATRDPIFLLQSRSWHLCAERMPQGWRYCHDAEDMVGPDGEVLTWRAFAERFTDHVFAVWRTESVWFTRWEAQTSAKRTEYRYPYGWRVYCVCAEGELAGLLKARSAKPTGTLSAPAGEGGGA